MLIEKVLSTNIEALNTIARAVLGDDTSGVRVGSQGGQIVSKINVQAESQQNLDSANAILDNWNALVVTADKTAMTEGDSDPVISCNDAQILTDATVGYVVLLDGVEYDSGTDVVVAGLVQLTLVAPVAGVYDVYIYRNNVLGNYASGTIRISVAEA